jgi:hypothetical protein
MADACFRAARDTFLFLGCSLSADRTIQTLLKVAQDEGPEKLPRHYAVIPCPTNTARKIAIQQRLADATYYSDLVPVTGTGVCRRDS